MSEENKTYQNVQELFEDALTKLVKQGRWCAGIEGCLYRAGNLKCIFGQIIPDDCYNIGMEDNTADDLIKNREEFGENWENWVESQPVFKNMRIDTFNDVAVFYSMQRLHDNKGNWQSVDYFQNAVREFAAEYNLNADFIDNLDWSNFQPITI